MIVNKIEKVYNKSKYQDFKYSVTMIIYLLLKSYNDLKKSQFYLSYGKADDTPSP